MLLTPGFIPLDVQVPNTLSFQADIQFEVANLKRQAKLLNNPDTFAQCAKLERKALALEKQLSRLQAQESTAKSNYLLRVPGVMRTGGLLCVFVLSYRVPVAVALRSEWVWPFGRSLAMGTGKPAITGLIGLLPWAVLSHRSSKALFGLRRRASS